MILKGFDQDLQSALNESLGFSLISLIPQKIFRLCFVPSVRDSAEGRSRAMGCILQRL